MTRDPLQDQNNHKGTIQKGFRRTSKTFLAYFFMVQASLPDSVSHQAIGREFNVGNCSAPVSLLGHQLSQNDHTTSGISRTLIGETANVRILKMAEDTEPATTQGQLALLASPSTTTIVCRSSLKGPALSAA